MDIWAETAWNDPDLSLIRSDSGATLPMSVAVGDKVLLPEFGGAKVSYDGDNALLPEFGDVKISHDGVNRKIRYVIYG